MSFNTFNRPGKPAFASLYSTKSAQAGDVIQQRKIQAIYGSNVKDAKKNVKTDANITFANAEQRLMYLRTKPNMCFTCKQFQNQRQGQGQDNVWLFDNTKYNLQMNLISYANMTYVDVLTQHPLVLDPSGQLFGNTPCGINNYVDYVHAIN